MRIENWELRIGQMKSLGFASPPKHIIGEPDSGTGRKNHQIKVPKSLDNPKEQN
jgi:hypothetical protein